MGFWQKYWNQAEQIESLKREGLFLERHVALLEGERDKYKYLAEQNAKQIVTERNKRDKDANRFHQTVTKLAGGNPQVFVEPKVIESPKPIQPTANQLAALRITAQEMLDDDRLNDIEPLSIDGYVERMLQDPDEYLSMMGE